MDHKGSLERTWQAITPSGYPIVVEEHFDNLSYIVEFYSGNGIGKDHTLDRCPLSGDVLKSSLLTETTFEVTAVEA